MNIVHAAKTHDWIKKNAKRLREPRRGTMQQCADEASVALGFKVSTTSLRKLMKLNGVPTKQVSKVTAERLSLLARLEQLEAENKKLREQVSPGGHNAGVRD